MLRNWNHLTSQLRTGIVGRREFLIAAAALGLSAGTIRATLAQTPKRGGHLIMGVDRGNTTDSLDPGTWNPLWPSNFGQQFYDQLTTVDEHMQPKPALAESWDYKSGAKVWVFKLRPGVTFHNGKTLAASDVVASLNYHRAKDSKSVAKSLVATFEDVAATGPNEVTITLTGGNVDMPYVLADWHLAIGPADKPFDGTGTGAFVLESFEPGVRGRAKRNTNDWRQDRGYVDTVETLVINDSTARISALLSGSAHIVSSVPTDNVERLQGNAQLQVFSAAGGQHGSMPMMADRAPYDNLDLRLALKYAIDRETILKTVLRGYGKLGNDQPIPTHDPMYAADIPQRQYDPDKAKFHYKKSGHTGELVFTTADNTFNGAIQAAQIFQANAKKVGIDIRIDRVPNDGYFPKYFGTGAAPFYASVWGGRPTADIMLTAAYSSTSPLNESHWKNENFDRILLAARGESDSARRKQMYRDLQLMVCDDAATIVPAFNNFVDGGRKTIAGFVPSPVQQLGGYRATEKVWFTDV